MAGEEPGKADDGEPGTPDPGDLRSKSVGQRFFIFSGGVLMNVLFGLVVFPILFWVGVPFTQPLMGPPTPGGPAWQAGLQAGTRVLEVNGQKVITFSEILNEIALGDPTACELLIQRPGSETVERIALTPTRSASRGLFELGIPPALDPDRTVSVKEGSPADLAGVSSGDHWISIEGSEPGTRPEAAFAELAFNGLPIRGTFFRPDTGKTYTTTITPVEVADDAPDLIGVIPVANQVAALRGEAWGPAGIRIGDRILDIDGRRVLSHADLSDGLAQASADSTIQVRRGGADFSINLPWPAVLEADDLALREGDDERRVRIVPRSAAAAAGMLSGDEILMVDEVSIDGKGTLLASLRTATKEGRPASIVLLRKDTSGERELTLLITSTPVPTLDYGLSLERAEYIYREKKPLDALLVGCGACVKFLQDSWLTLHGIITNRVPGKNVGGPIMIGVIAHSFASVSWTKLFFFLSVLSMNLAFLNVLPIPLLDGGHLFFLLIEKLKGSPVSDRIMGFSQLAGLVLIGFIFVYILYHDIQRTIG